ncbi:MAG: sulfur carrier protein ThiS [Deltaproteobacteria bacterium]|nr:sulfur carrier protein ThiS [Deltaproteobacteria bacterium]
MKIKLNGEEREIAEGMALSGLLQELRFSTARVAVELNREIIPPEVYGETTLADGDVLEVVGFVGGG